MTNKSLISIIIPCYNHEKYIYKAVMSVLQQTYSNIELLVADDCSTDNSAAILREINDPRLRTFFFEKNRGTVFTLNFLLQRANGEYIATLGSDDYFDPKKLEKQLKIMEENPNVGAVFTWAEIIDGNDQPYEDGQPLAINVFQEPNRSRAQWIRYFFADGNHLCHSSAMVRKEVHNTLGVYRRAYRQLHDFDYWLRLLCKYPIYVIPEKLTVYRRVDEASSLSASRSSANMIRLYNEFNSIYFDLFRTMDAELFVQAFSDLLDNPCIKNDSALDKEKYLVLRQLTLGGCKIRGAAQRFFLNYVNKDIWNDEIDSDQDALINLYYSDSAQVDVEYPIDELGLAETYPVVAEKLRAVEEHCRNLTMVLEGVYNSSSWKITKPLRALKRFIKKYCGG